MKDSTEGTSIPPSVKLLSTPLAFIGDTFHHVGANVEPLLGFQPNKAMVKVPFQTFIYWHADLLFVQVYAGVFPFDSSEFPRLEESIKRVCSPFQKPSRFKLQLNFSS
jgi:hypothetical protein